MKQYSDDSSDIMEEYVDYDDEIPDDSDHDRLEESEKIGPSDSPAKPKFSNNAVSTGIQLASNLVGQDNSNFGGNKLLNQFHTNIDDSDVEESDYDGEKDRENEGKSLVDTLIRLYNNDPDSLGEFERDLVEKELEKRGGLNLDTSPFKNAAINKTSLKENSKESEKKEKKPAQVEKPASNIPSSTSELKKEEPQKPKVPEKEIAKPEQKSKPDPVPVQKQQKTKPKPKVKCL